MDQAVACNYCIILDEPAGVTQEGFSFEHEDGPVCRLYEDKKFLCLNVWSEKLIISITYRVIQ